MPALAGTSWPRQLAPYTRPHVPRSILDVLTSAVPYVAVSVAIYRLRDVSLLAVLPLMVLAAGFLLRTYILFHDCGHGSFLPNKAANRWLGRLLALMVFTPFHAWRHAHAVHHATAGDLERRGVGDVPTWTVAEYNAAGRGKRAAYWLFRFPLVMFLLGPIWSMIVGPRIWRRSQRPRVRNSIILTNIGLVLIVGGFCALIGWQNYLFVVGPPALIAGATGVFLFYVQHQFEEVYWENSESWTYEEAALRGSSYLRLPNVLRFFTGNIGFHHVHHLSARIPNYKLPQAHAAMPVFESVPILSVWDGVKCARLKLFDEESKRLVTFREARAARARHRPDAQRALIS